MSLQLKKQASDKFVGEYRRSVLSSKKALADRILGFVPSGLIEKMARQLKAAEGPMILGSGVLQPLTPASPQTAGTDTSQSKTPPSPQTAGTDASQPPAAPPAHPAQSDQSQPKDQPTAYSPPPPPSSGGQAQGAQKPSLAGVVLKMYGLDLQNLPEPPQPPTRYVPQPYFAPFPVLQPTPPQVFYFGPEGMMTPGAPGHKPWQPPPRAMQPAYTPMRPTAEAVEAARQIGRAIGVHPTHLINLAMAYTPTAPSGIGSAHVAAAAQMIHVANLQARLDKWYQYLKRRNVPDERIMELLAPIRQQYDLAAAELQRMHQEMWDSWRAQQESGAPLTYEGTYSLMPSSQSTWTPPDIEKTNR